MPDVASVPVNCSETGWIHQPSWSGARSVVNPVTVGSVLSILIVAIRFVRPLWSLWFHTAHMTAVPAVSLSKTCGLEQSLPGTGATMKLMLSQSHRSWTVVVCQVEQLAGAAGCGGVHA